MASPVFEFAEFELDAGGYKLRGAGRTVRLQRIPMDLLILLLEHKGALVTREQIVARVWNGDGLVDTQSSINTAIRKIRQALGDDGEQPQFIETVIGKGYRFVGEVSVRAPAPEAAVPVKSEVLAAQPKHRRTLLVVTAVAAAAAVAVLLVNRSAHTPAPLTIAPFTAVPGLHAWPAFSPDGNQIAFGWTGTTGNCSHLYVQAVGRASAVQLTNGRECDSSPSWSRDGRWIAFLRQQPEGNLGLYAIAAASGSARKIAAVNGPHQYRPAWLPDGTGIIVMDSNPPGAPPSLFRVAFNSGEKQRVTTAESTGTGDWCPAFSPDGRRLAYLHNTGSRRLSPLYVVPVDARGLPIGTPEKVETGSARFSDFDWSADGRSLVASVPGGLVRVPASGGVVQPLPFPDGNQPAIALRGNRMVYTQPLQDSDIFRVPGSSGSGPAKDLISSTRRESAPQYSADGRRVAFVSDRTGSDEIWVSDGNGSDWRRITSFAGPAVGSPRWSPDGKWIAFDSTAGGRAGIYIAGASGGAARRLTSAGVACVRPSWSHDGRWIYFGSEQNAGWQIWKTTPQGASPIQVTRGGGREAFEAPGGMFLYYTKAPPAKGIWRMTLNSDPELGNGEEKVSDFGTQGKWAVGGHGFYYVNATGQLMFQEFSTMRSCQISTPGLQLGLSNLMGASPDDRWVLLTALVRSGDDLMLVQDFH